MSESIYPSVTPELARQRRETVPAQFEAFHNFSKAVFAPGALDSKTKQLIAVAVAHVTQCPYCIAGHSKQAAKEGATREEMMEAIWVAAEMRAGAAYAHSIIALDAITDGAKGQAAG
ncbi:MAG: carboxymuconolactone decarboxylase family protein [Phycisphaerae bacterium]